MTQRKWDAGWTMVLVLAGCGDGDAASVPEPAPPDYAAHTFVPIDPLGSPPQVTADRLCDEAADPEAAPDKVFIHCRTEEAGFGPTDLAPKRDLVVMTYNMERGLALDAQIDALRNDPRLPAPDVLLVSEVDRGCSRTNERDVFWELAEALEMNGVFAVEFVELPRPSGGGGTITQTCEHGNAVLSRYPLGNAGTLRHTQNRSWYIPPEDRVEGGEPRLGGRILVFADVKVGERYLHVYSLHFASDAKDIDIQAAQAAETAEHGLTQPFQVVQGGDTNAGLYTLALLADNPEADPTTLAFFTRGYVDAHAALPREERGTHGSGTIILDLLLGNGAFFSTPSICPVEACGALSDHLPVWATVRLR